MASDQELTPNPLAQTIAHKLARTVFAKRGNHSEAHITEVDLATIIEAGCRVYGEQSQRA